MNDGAGSFAPMVFARMAFAQGGQAAADEILYDDVSDAALEAATLGGALSFPNAPTVSILVVCCSFDGS
jgi:hypothetical protein